MEDFTIDFESYEVENRYVISNKLYIHHIEYRKDPLTDTWVRINKNLSKKPRIISEEKPKSIESCPFCRENVFNVTPKFTDHDRFILNNSMIFPNKYPYAKYHFVLVPNINDHITSFSELKFEDFYNSFILIKEISKYVISKDPNYRYLLINLNKGLCAGASQPHLHLQIIFEKDLHGRLGIFMDKSKKYFDHRKRFLIEDYMELEKKSGERIVREDTNCIIVSPFAPFRNNEILGMLKSFGLFFMATVKLREFLSNLYNLLVKYEKKFGYFNMTFLDTSLLKEGKTFPIFRVGQRFRNDIGFLELYYGEFVISIPPEETARELRSILSE